MNESSAGAFIIQNSFSNGQIRIKILHSRFYINFLFSRILFFSLFFASLVRTLAERDNSARLSGISVQSIHIKIGSFSLLRVGDVCVLNCHRVKECVKLRKKLTTNEFER